MIGQLDQRGIKQLLRRCVVGRIACHASGRTYIVPITYAYEDGTIISHSSEGLKISMMRENPDVCFEIDHVDDLGNWSSVVAWGRYEELHGHDATHAMTILLGKLSLMAVKDKNSYPKELTHQHATHDDQSPIVYCIRITEATGRYDQT